MRTTQIFRNAFQTRYNPLTKTSHWRCANTKCPSKPTLGSVDYKVALITGGSEGIGFRIANHLLKEGARAVTLTGLDVCSGKEAVNCLNNAYGHNKAMFINSNVNCMSEMEETFQITKETFNHIDIVINCAAICEGSKWEHEIVTNVVGTIRTTLLTFKHLGKDNGGKGGVLINVSGIGGLEPMAPVPTLSCCHHGIIGLTRSFGNGVHFDKSKVRVLCLCPGLTSTNFMKGTNVAMTQNLDAEMEKYVKNGVVQTPDVGGLAALHLIRYAENGSVWIVDGSQLYSADIPKWNQYSKLQEQYL